MATYPLNIVTPDKMIFSGDVQRLIVRTVEGDIGILAGHIDYTAPLDIGAAKIVLADGTERMAACNGGFLSVVKGSAYLAAITFEWADAIDADRARRSKEEAEHRLAEIAQGDKNYAAVSAKLRRALARLAACGENS